MKKEIDEILAAVVHPETGKSLAESSMVESIALSDERIAVTLLFSRSRDPFAVSIKKQVERRLLESFPEMAGKISVLIKEGAPKKPKPAGNAGGTAEISRIVAVASGKGGVGKSTVTANLAVSLASMGYKVGVLDADIYGPSQAKMFGLEDYTPVAENIDGQEMIIPAESRGVKIMSIAYFITDRDALVWRGPMATGALRQLIHQTLWGRLDYLLLDLPPGTGDVHLTVLKELKVDGAIIVSTPQQIAIADVVRGITMFRSENIAIPVLGLVENMAWFTPAELPDNRYYIFGNGGGAELARREGIALLGQIPIIQSIMDGAEAGEPAAIREEVKPFYQQAAEKIVDKLPITRQEP